MVVHLPVSLVLVLILSSPHHQIREEIIPVMEEFLNNFPCMCCLISIKFLMLSCEWFPVVLLFKNIRPLNPWICLLEEGDGIGLNRSDVTCI